MHQQQGSPAAVIVAVCLVGLSVAGFAMAPAAATPSTYLDKAKVDSTEVLVGDTVTVTAVVGNVGTSRGGHSVTFTRNGTTVARERVVVEPDERERTSINVTLDRPGVYELRADGELAGYVRASRTLATESSRLEASRDVNVRVNSVPLRETYYVQMPAAQNRSVTLEQWNVTTSEHQFEQTVTEYTDPAAADVPLPSSHVTVAGVVSVSSSVPVDATEARVAVTRSRLDALGLDPDNVSLYQYQDGQWQSVDTEAVERRADAVVYEGSVTNGSAFAIGRFSPVFSISETSLNTVDADGGQRIVVEATVANDGAIADDYELSLSVNGESVNQTAVLVAPGESRTVTLSSVTTSAGSYNVAVNDQSVGVVQIVESQVETPTPEGSTPTPTAAATVTPTPTDAATPGSGSGGGGDGLLPSSLPDTIAGISTVLLVGVGAGVLIFLVIGGLLWRSGRSKGGSDPNRW